jgi:hypothetical protein
MKSLKKSAVACAVAALLAAPVAFATDYREGGAHSPAGSPNGADARAGRPTVDERVAPTDRSSTTDRGMGINRTDRGDHGTDRADRSDGNRDHSGSSVTAKIKAKMALDREVSAMNIKVNADDRGVVTLSGDAKNKQEADKAVSIARGVEGVQSVKNDIKVSPNR